MNAPQHSVPVPSRMMHLARDHRGFLVPFFVAWMKDGKQVRRGLGVPDFRVVDPEAMIDCVNRNRCWLCGDPLGRHKAFVLGPMCVITRVNSEPPSHRDCAEYALRVCPFLTKPTMRRNESEYQSDVIAAAGEHSAANPGVMALWITDGAEMFNADWGQPGVLFQVNDPREVVWWREGRHATVEEVTLGLAKAMPALEMQAARKGRDAIIELERLSAQALTYLPKAGELKR
jgi:hypothetical protein